MYKTGAGTDMCASRRGPPRRIQALYNVGSPMEWVTIDVLGPLPTSEDGNKYLLIAADYFTKWVEVYALPNQEEVTVADVLVKEFVCRFGVPLFIHSDQGRNFESAVFGEMCRLLGITKIRTTPLHPQSDGMGERFNQTIESQLSKYVQDHQRDWDRHIPFLLMAYRTATNETTGHTPAQLMIGWNLRLPIDLAIERPKEENPQFISSYTDQLLENLENVHEFAREHLQMMSNKMKECYDLSSQRQTLNRGDAVWLYNSQRNKGVTSKLACHWQGPYLITKRINDIIYGSKSIHEPSQRWYTAIDYGSTVGNLHQLQKSTVIKLLILVQLKRVSPPQMLVPLEKVMLMMKMPQEVTPSQLLTSSVLITLTVCTQSPQEGKAAANESRQNVMDRTLTDHSLSLKKRGEWCCELTSVVNMDLLLL